MPFLVTDTGVIIHDNSVVILSQYPNVKWLIKNGWYTYKGKQYNGWYFSSIPANNTMPVDTSDLSGITLVSGPNCCPPPPGPVPPGPGPSEERFTHELRNQLERAWITVDTIEQRDRLNIRLVPDGKVVKVNDVGGSVKYYSYDQSLSTWVEEVFGLDGLFVKKEDLENEVNDLVNGDTSLHESIVNVSKSVASAKWSEIQE